MWLLAQQVADPSNPVSYSPLAIVAAVVTFLLWRMKDSDADNRKRVAELEHKIELLTDEITEQRSLKHRALNRVAAAEGTLSLVARMNKSCTCGALVPIEPLLRGKDTE